jgi:hypothetical protein
MWTAAFFAALAFTATLAIRDGDPGLRRTAFAMLGNWVACTVAVIVLHDFTPWFMFALFDMAAARVVLMHPSGRPQAIIGVIYLFQIVFHVSYALVGSSAAALLYLDMLSFGAWLQVGTLAGGAIYGGGRKVLAARHLRARLLASNPPHSGSMGAPE